MQTPFVLGAEDKSMYHHVLELGPTLDATRKYSSVNVSKDLACIDNVHGDFKEV